MRLSLGRFERRDAAAIARLNDRLRAGHVDLEVYPEPTDPAEAAAFAERPIRERLYVARDGEEVCGAVWLREHGFRVGGADVTAGWAKYPVAESLVNPAYSGVPGSLVFQLLREQPRLMALGMGGHGGSFARLLKGMRWTGISVPFLVMVAKPANVLRRLTYLRSSPLRRLLMDAAAFSGVGWLAGTAFRLLRTHASGDAVAEVVPEFGPWADDVWQACRDAYGFVARRDAAMLATLYPPSFRAITRLRVRRAGRDIGWACCARFDLRQGTEDRRFGRLVVGVLADGLSLPADAASVTTAAVRHLIGSGVDLIVSNQSHPAWVAALRNMAFIDGPSNFAFYCSPAMQQLIGIKDVTLLGLHLNRGDCDGPGWVND